MEKTNLEEEFLILKENWMKETMFHSAPNIIYSNKHYLKILSFGKNVVPFIIKDYFSEDFNQDWCWALNKILGVDPVKKENWGYVEKMRNDWKAYFRDKNIDEILSYDFKS
jgi:hypothetical protein